MKKKINLLSKQKKYLRLERIFQILRMSILIAGIAVFILDIMFFGILLRQKQQLDILNAEKTELLNFLLTNKSEEINFAYFRNKQKQISLYLKNDVNFFPYYNLLNDSLKSSSPQAQLESVLIDRSKEADFSVVFEDFASLLSFFKFAESDAFLKNFSDLSLKSFNLGPSQNNILKLTFKGIFKDIK